MNTNGSLRHSRTPDHKPRPRLKPAGRYVLGGLAAMSVLALLEGPKVVASIDPTSGDLSQPTEQAISDGLGHVNTHAETTFGPSTVFTSSPEDMEDAGDGQSNVVYTVQPGQKVRVKGVIAGVNPNNAGSTQEYQAVSLQIPGQESPSIVWTTVKGLGDTGTIGSPHISFVGDTIVASGGPNGNYLTGQGELITDRKG